MSYGKILLSGDKGFGLCPEDSGESVTNFKLRTDMSASVLKLHPGCSVENGLDAQVKADGSIFISTQNERGKDVCSFSVHAYSLPLDSRLQTLSLEA